MKYQKVALVNFRERYKEYIENTWDPHIIPSKGNKYRMGHGDKILAPEYEHSVTGARERFRNRKIGNRVRGNWTERWYLRQEPRVINSAKANRKITPKATLYK